MSRSRASRSSRATARAPLRGHATHHEAEVSIPACYEADGARRVTIEDCEFGHVGITGCGSATAARIVGWYIRTSRSRRRRGAHREGPDRQPNEVERTSHVVVDKQIIQRRLGPFTWAPSACGSVKAENNQVTNNDIGGFCYTGVSVGWTWGYGPSLAQRNRIAFQPHTHHLGPVCSATWAGFIHARPFRGHDREHKRHHDVVSYDPLRSWRLGTLTMTKAARTSNWRATSIYRVKTGTYHQHYGRENVVRNNILAFKRRWPAPALRASRATSRSASGIHLVVWNGGRLFRRQLEGPNVIVASKSYWEHERRAGEAPRGLGLAAWQKLGQGHRLVIADPAVLNRRAIRLSTAARVRARKRRLQMRFDLDASGEFTGITPRGSNRCGATYPAGAIRSTTAARAAAAH